MMNDALQVLHLKKKYDREVLKDVTLCVNRGEVVGLLGPNGAGKTTTFYAILGLIKVDAGNILITNQDITNLPVHSRAKLGMNYLPQEPSLFRKLTVSENIMAILELRSELTREQRQYLCDRLLDELHITAIKDALGLNLSGGERRRAEIARTLATEPRYILLDEPFAGIDPISVMDVKNIINHLRHRNIGILITDHNVRETLAICDRAYIVNDGAILSEGTAQAIVENNAVRQIYLGEEFNL